MLLDSFCNVKCIGRVGPTPIITFREDGSVMASFKVSTCLPLRIADQATERIVWQNVIAFGKVAEFVRDHISEGTRVFFDGTVYPTLVTDSKGQRIPQIQLAAARVIPLTTREDKALLKQKLAQVHPPRMRPVQVVPLLEDPDYDAPF